MTRPRRSFGEGREGAVKGGKVSGRPWGSREAMAWRCGLGGAATGQGGMESAAVRRGVKKRGRKGTRPQASISLCRALTGGASQPRPDRWRGKAYHVSG